MTVVIASEQPLDLGAQPGLSEDEARLRLVKQGPNELSAQKKRGLLTIVLEVVREPMFIMLIVAGGLYLLLGDATEAMMLLGFVFVVMGITIVQSNRTEHALDALKDLSSPRALVIRGGAHRRVPGREVVQGDWIVLSEGDRVPADAILRQGINLSADESLLTGESAPVRKAASTTDTKLQRPGGEDLSSLFSGTLVSAGQGVAEVASTGAHSELGRIGKSLQQVKTEPTSLQKDAARLVRLFALIGLGAFIVVVVAYALTRGGSPAAWKQGLLAGITMAMSILPEEIPVVLTIFLALGAWRISRKRVLTRRMAAVETLGKTTVLCVDKTGTLTLNRMTVKHVIAGGHASILGPEATSLPEEMHQVLEYAILASARDPFDPMERALHATGDRVFKNTEHLHPSLSLVRAYPLSVDLAAVTQAWQSGQDTDVSIASRAVFPTLVPLPTLVVMCAGCTRTSARSVQQSAEARPTGDLAIYRVVIRRTDGPDELATDAQRVRRTRSPAPGNHRRRVVCSPRARATAKSIADNYRGGPRTGSLGSIRYAGCVGAYCARAERQRLLVTMP
jgi:Ca2+-transporting ATPase